MLEKITGSCYRDMIIYGVNNLENHCSVVNDLNVFPVPDGDTGTNMVMTIKNGLYSTKDSDDLGRVAESFAGAAVFGARGNSGVIISQFFKGMANTLKNMQYTDCQGFVNALQLGCEYAYSAVANPTEGTVLTVLKEATEAVNKELDGIDSVDELISKFLTYAKISLENTPNLLPVLHKAGVVDSGGAGIVYFFEGIQKYLNGEEIVVLEDEPDNSYIDYSLFNKDSNFEYGYCTELLLQVTVESFDYSAFSDELARKGDSLVVSFDDYKVKLHIHTKTPEKILDFCHAYGEFLSLKIENMSVQHTSISKISCAKNQSEGDFSVVAVAPNSLLCEMLLKMGADVVITSREVPSSKDFIEAFEHAKNDNILVFPNSSNSIMSAIQAGDLYESARVTVLSCRSFAECYCSLPIIDFDECVESVVEDVNSAIENIYTVSLVQAGKDIKFGDSYVKKGDYFALSGEEILATGATVDQVVLKTVDDVLNQKDCSVVNMFYGKKLTSSQISDVVEKLEASCFGIDIMTVPTEDEIIDLVLSFE